MRQLLAILVMVLGASVPAWAQISVPNTFITRTTMSSANVNQNFNELGTKALNRTGGTMTGSLTTQAVLPDGNNTRAFGAVATRYASVYSVLGDFSGAVATGALTVTGAGAISGDFAIATNKFTVASATGNTVVAGTLVVTGATNLNGAVAIAAGLQAGSGNVAIIDATGKIPAISSIYFASLSGTSLTGVALLASNNTFTARNDFKLYSETKASPAIAAGALTIDLSAATHFQVALNAAITTFTVSNPVASGTVGSFSIKFVADGTVRAITWPGSFKWAGNAAPTAMTGALNRKDIVTCVYDDGGTSYNCVISQNFSS